MFLSVCVLIKHFSFEDHQTVEPNAKYTCTTKPFYATDILKPNGTEPKLSFNQVEPKRTEPGQNSNQTEPEPWPWPNQNQTFVSGFDSQH